MAAHSRILPICVSVQGEFCQCCGACWASLQLGQALILKAVCAGAASVNWQYLEPISWLKRRLQEGGKPKLKVCDPEALWKRLQIWSFKTGTKRLVAWGEGHAELKWVKRDACLCGFYTNSVLRGTGKSFLSAKRSDQCITTDGGKIVTKNQG